MTRFLVLFLLLFGALSAQEQLLAGNQPLHESFVSYLGDPIPFEVIPKKPPASMDETRPEQPNPHLIWIPGYWTWTREIQDFTWICGVWRNPPPDHVWTIGYWKSVKEGWVWIRGAWTPDPAKTHINQTSSKQAPPSPQNEATGKAPGPDYFWSFGSWSAEPDGDFEWLSGSWQKYDPSWILETAHWIWRPEGYLFIPSYWDWNLESRGIVYDCKTREPLRPQEIALQLTGYYPDYLAVCSHAWHFIPDYWEKCACTPPWWRWQEWWSIPWEYHWWLWWWYLHPQYPYPPFLTVDVINMIPPPTTDLLEQFHALSQPFFITPFGVPTISDWVKAIRNKYGDNQAPFLSSSSMSTLLNALQKKLPKTGLERPRGSNEAIGISKPFVQFKKAAAGIAPVPELPKMAAGLPPSQAEESSEVPAADVPTQMVPVPPPVEGYGPLYFQSSPEEPDLYILPQDTDDDWQVYYPEEGLYYPYGYWWGGSYRGVYNRDFYWDRGHGARKYDKDHHSWRHRGSRHRSGGEHRKADHRRGKSHWGGGRGSGRRQDRHQGDLDRGGSSQWGGGHRGGNHRSGRSQWGGGGGSGRRQDRHEGNLDRGRSSRRESGLRSKSHRSGRSHWGGGRGSGHGRSSQKSGRHGGSQRSSGRDHGGGRHGGGGDRSGGHSRSHGGGRRH